MSSGATFPSGCTSAASASRPSPWARCSAAFGLSVFHVLKLVALPHEARYLYCHCWQMVRIGSIDFNFDFGLDPLSRGDDPHHHRRRLAHPHLRRRLHGDGEGVLALFHVPEPVRLLDAPPGARRRVHRDVLRLGGRRPLQLPAHRLLVRGLQEGQRRHEGVRRQPRRRLGLRRGAHAALLGPRRSWLQGGFYQPDNLARLAIVSAQADEHGARGARRGREIARQATARKPVTARQPPRAPARTPKGATAPPRPNREHGTGADRPQGHAAARRI